MRVLSLVAVVAVLLHTGCAFVHWSNDARSRMLAQRPIPAPLLARPRLPLAVKQQKATVLGRIRPPLAALFARSAAYDEDDGDEEEYHDERDDLDADATMQVEVDENEDEDEDDDGYGAEYDEYDEYDTGYGEEYSDEGAEYGAYEGAEYDEYDLDAYDVDAYDGVEGDYDGEDFDDDEDVSLVLRKSSVL